MLALDGFVLDFFGAVGAFFHGLADGLNRGGLIKMAESPEFK